MNLQRLVHIAIYLQLSALISPTVCATRAPTVEEPISLLQTVQHVHYGRPHSSNSTADRQLLSLFNVESEVSSDRSGTAPEECQLPPHGQWCDVSDGVGGAGSYRMAVHHPDKCILSKRICETGSWEVEPGELELFLGKPGRAVDIGANIGFHTLALARLGWKVAAFEPLPANQQLLEASLCANPELKERVKLHKVGLGPEPGQCDIVSGSDNVGDGYMRCGEYTLEKGWHYKKRGVVPIRRLDDFHIPPVDFVKMDVEGFECQVMMGGQKLLTEGKPKLIQTEVWTKLQKSEECSSSDYLNMYAQNGYRVTHDRACSADWPEPLSPPTYTSDFFMCRKLQGLQ